MEAHHIQRELWRWLMQDEKNPKKESGAIVCITHLDEGEWPKLDWKTSSGGTPSCESPSPRGRFQEAPRHLLQSPSHRNK